MNNCYLKELKIFPQIVEQLHIDFPLGPILGFCHHEYVHDSNDDHSMNYCTEK